MVLMGIKRGLYEKREIQVPRVRSFAVKWATIAQIINMHLSQQIFFKLNYICQTKKFYMHGLHKHEILYQISGIH